MLSFIIFKLTRFSSQKIPTSSNLVISSVLKFESKLDKKIMILQILEAFEKVYNWSGYDHFLGQPWKEILYQLFFGVYFSFRQSVFRPNPTDFSRSGWLIGKSSDSHEKDRCTREQALWHLWIYHQIMCINWMFGRESQKYNKKKV